MKRKIYIQPHDLLFSVVLILLGLSAKRFDHNIFVFDMIIAVITAGIIIAWSLKYRHYVNHAVRGAIKGIKGVNHSYLEKFSVPVVVTDRQGSILWYNKKFHIRLAQDKDYSGDPISPFINGLDPDMLIDNTGTNIEFDGTYYTVIASDVDDGIVFYYIDDTDYKVTARLYTDSRPIVITASLDNRDDFERNIANDDVNLALIKIETSLKKWVTSCNGMYIKTAGGRYKIIIDEKNLRGAIEEKFNILDYVRSIKISDDSPFSATISMGVGRGAKSFIECEEWSLRALDLAFGRGGDQVVIKSNDGYDFFGGVSQGVEKYEKIKARVIAKSLAAKIAESDNIFIMGHQTSDLDAVGAAVGMWSVISKTFKNHYTKIVINQETTLTGLFLKKLNENGYSNAFIEPSTARKNVSDKTLLIIVDTHSPTFVEDPELYKMCKNIVVIDHHRMMVNHIENASVFFHEPFASSACEMVTQLIQYMNEDALNNYEAEALLAGIMLDTKNFVLRTGVNTFEAAAFLKRKGADTVEVKRLFSDSIVSYRTRSKLVADAKAYRNSAISIADEDMNRQKNIRITAAQAADELLGIKDIQASYVIYKSLGNTCISARSLGDQNVQLVMEYLGGGGHQTMAGANLGDVSSQEAYDRLIEAIDKMGEKASDSTSTIKRRILDTEKTNKATE